jgi:V-type H+-transporting ATPase subunit a
MGDMWRSEAMTLLQFVIPTDDAHDVVFDLGNLGVVQFKDLNPEVNTFQRNFVNEILRIDELQRKLRYFDEQLKKTGRHPPDPVDRPQRLKPLGPQEIPEMENFFEETERELQQMNDGFEAITQNIKTHEEHVRVLLQYDAFVSEYESDGGTLSLSISLPLFSLSLDLSPSRLIDIMFFALLGSYSPSSLSWHFVGYMSGAFLAVKSGVIATDRVHTFERILWRATKGNIFLRSADLKDDSEEGGENGTERKSMFMIMYKVSTFNLL